MVDILTDRTIQQTLEEVVKSLNDFVSKGLLVVEHGPMSFIQEPFSTKITVRQTIRLHLKDQEHIEKLEKENEELRNFIAEHVKESK